MKTVEQKMDELTDHLRALGSAVLAYSGGVDSAFLGAMATQALGKNLLAVTADSPSIPRSELEAAARLARRLGMRHEVIETSELSNPAYAENPPDRCFHCKGELFSRLRTLAGERGVQHVLDGANADDRGDHRPGRRAAAQWQVRSPLAETGWTKEEVRAGSRRLGLPTADRPASACLASRIPYGQVVTIEALGRVERAEAALVALGFSGCRVRHHEDVARIELAPEQIERMLDADRRAAAAHAVREAGFRFVALDLEGYRTGRLNESLGADQLERAAADPS